MIKMSSFTDYEYAVMQFIINNLMEHTLCLCMLFGGFYGFFESQLLYIIIFQ